MKEDPGDADLARIVVEDEADTPWPGVAAPGGGVKTSKSLGGMPDRDRLRACGQ